MKILFEQLSPMLPSVLNRKENRFILQEASGANFWNHAAQIASNKIVSELSEFITNTGEIAQAMSEALPGGSGLQTLLKEELDKIIQSREPIFVENREFLKEYIEGIILLYLVKIVRANENGNVFALLRSKIGKFSNREGGVEARAEAILDEILADVFRIRSEQDLLNVPPAVKELVFSKIKEKMRELVSPILIPILERRRVRLSYPGPTEPRDGA